MHASMMAQPSFEMASDAAMLQTRLNLPLATTTEQAAANHYRMQGAENFLLVLMTLGDPFPLPPEPPKTDLNYEATKVR